MQNRVTDSIQKVHTRRRLQADVEQDEMPKLKLFLADHDGVWVLGLSPLYSMSPEVSIPAEISTEF